MLARISVNTAAKYIYTLQSGISRFSGKKEHDELCISGTSGTFNCCTTNPLYCVIATACEMQTLYDLLKSVMDGKRFPVMLLLSDGFPQSGTATFFLAGSHQCQVAALEASMH